MLFSLKQGQDFLLHGPLGGSPAEAGGGRLALGAQPLPSDTSCACEACSERRYGGRRRGAPRGCWAGQDGFLLKAIPPEGASGW